MYSINLFIILKRVYWLECSCLIIFSQQICKLFVCRSLTGLLIAFSCHLHTNVVVSGYFCSVSRFGPRHLLFYLHTPEAWTVIILLACCQHASVSNPVSAWTHSCTAWALWLHCSVYTCRGRIQLPCIWAASNWAQVQVLAWTYQDTSPCSWLSLETLPG